MFKLLAELVEHLFFFRIRKAKTALLFNTYFICSTGISGVKMLFFLNTEPLLSTYGLNRTVKRKLYIYI